MSQEHYWKEFYRLKVHINYLELVFARTDTIDRSIKMFLAVTSSASIGGWVIWKAYAPIWAFLIAASQVINAVRQYLPYKERLRRLASLLNDLEELAVQVESKWLDIAAGEQTEREIRKSLNDLRSRRSKILRKHPFESTVPDDSTLLTKAEASAQEYFQNFYSQEKTR